MKLLTDHVPTEAELTQRRRVFNVARKIRANQKSAKTPSASCRADGAFGSQALLTASGGWVLDAGIAAKWYLGEEPLAAHAIEVLRRFQRGDAELLVPDLFWPEFGNVLWKAVRQSRLAPADAKRAITSLTGGILPTVPSMPLLADAFSLAHATGRTVYDATYLALAIQTGRAVLTADERLVNALGTRYPVRWLGSLVF